MSDTRDIALNEIGVLKRREIEARILAPFVDALSREFGREKVLQIVRETIVGIAKDQGGQLVQISQGDGLREFAAALPNWTKEDALECNVTTNCASTSRDAATPRCTNHSAWASWERCFRASVMAH